MIQDEEHGLVHSLCSNNLAIFLKRVGKRTEITKESLSSEVKINKI